MCPAHPIVASNNEIIEQAMRHLNRMVPRIETFCPLHSLRTGLHNFARNLETLSTLRGYGCARDRHWFPSTPPSYTRAAAKAALSLPTDARGGVVDIFVTGETSDRRSSQTTCQDMPHVLAARRLRQDRPAHLGQPESINQIVIGSRPASDVILLPWNCSFGRRSKLIGWTAPRTASRCQRVVAVIDHT